MIKISVIVPCYNQAQFLPETLQSVLDQTYSNWECIIVNDGSTDNTEQVALEWSEKDKRFTYLYKDNGGLSSARNTGIEQAQGKWILPLDSDDKINCRYLELSIQSIKKNPELDIIYCKAETFGMTTSSWCLRDYNYKKLLFTNMIFCSALFKKESWEKAKGYDLNLKRGREDWEFWINILTESSRVLCLDYIGFFYRRKEDSMDVSLNKDKEIKLYAENYIYDKHRNIYTKFFGSPQQVLYEKMLLEEKIWRLEQDQEKIHKNIITRILYRIIRFFI